MRLKRIINKLKYARHIAHGILNAGFGDLQAFLARKMGINRWGISL